MDPVVKSSAKVALGVLVGCDQISSQLDMYNELGHQISKKLSQQSPFFHNIKKLLGAAWRHHLTFCGFIDASQKL